MKFTEYNALALRTAPVGVTAIHDLKHAAMGMVTEAGEIIDALKKFHAYGRSIDVVNVAEECGDGLWYIPLLCRGLQCPVTSVVWGGDNMPVFENAGDGMAPALEEISARLAMRAARIFVEAVQPYPDFALIRQQANSYVDCLAQVCAVINRTLPEVAATNIAKLRARYPDKFTAESALNRDLTKERAILEGRQ